ncbi:cysteine desulfurase-like protein [Streptomyces sp. NPDC004237]|uniref:cysteine desulfurase-like protein n=1 Tax=Streptomyces sp. NPDC004237 TaxID=3154455 RepID=UPI0033BC8E0E
MSMSPEPFDVEALRSGFPSLASGIAHFDGPGGTQTPAAVGEAIARTLTGPLSNRGRAISSEENAEHAITAFRSAYADLLGVPSNGVVYGRSATQIAYDFSRHLSRDWGPGDEVVVTRLDHDSNVRPWGQAAERVGATVRRLEMNTATSELVLDDLDSVVTERTRVVAVTGASNLLGTKPPVRFVADRAHQVGALVYVDGVHYAAHTFVDVPALGADFFVCSPYKFFGPHCALLGAEPALLETIRPDKLLPSTNVVPERFEFGTLPYEIMAGAAAAVDFLASLAPGTAGDRRGRLAASYEAVEKHEQILRDRMDAGLDALNDRIAVHSHAQDRTPTTLMTFPGRRSWDAYLFLAERDILAPAGSFYAHEAFTALALEDQHALRVGLAPYNTVEEIDRLLNALDEFTSC